MEKFKAFAFGALVFTSLLCGQSASDDNFEDADKDSDYSSSSFNGNNEKWDLRHTIPGEPDVDYPIYAYPIRTSFSCDSRHQGYYADVEARCQVFRICTNTALSGEGFAFLCPNGTLFSQKNFVCDWYRNVDCSNSENFYFKNEEIGKSMNHDNLMENVKEMVEYPMRTISKALGLTGGSTTTSLNQPKSQNDSNNITNINTSGVNHHSNHASGEKLTRNQIADRNKSAGIDVRSDIIENTDLNDKNQRTRYNQQQQTTYRSRQRNNDNNSRGRSKDSRTNQNTNLRSKPNIIGTTITSTTANNKEQTAVQKLTLPDKIYVNTLGELSTDVGSNFDIKTSYIIKPDADSTATRRGSKKSLDDVLGDSEAYKNHLKNQQREKLREGLLGSTKSHYIIATPTITKNISKIENQEDHLQLQSDTKLSFAESVNAGLTTTIQNTKSRISLEPKKLNKSNENYLNLADNINSGLIGGNEKNKNHKIITDIPETIKKQEEQATNYQRKIVNIESRLGTQGTITSEIGGQSFHGYESSSAQTKTITSQNPNSFRNGRQFKFLGSGFTRSDNETGITVEPYVSNLKSNTYLPPLLSRTSNDESKNLKIKDSLLIQLNNDQENLKNLLLDINNINNNDEVSASNIHKIQVKKRAEELLLQGVHQTLYENHKGTTSNNITSIIDKTIIDDNNNNNILQETSDVKNTKMVIRVYGDSEEETNNNNNNNNNADDDNILHLNDNNSNKSNNTDRLVKTIFRLTTELSAGPILVTDSNDNEKNIDLNTETITDSEIITSSLGTTIIPNYVVSTESITTTDSTSILIENTSTTQTDNKNFVKFRKLNNNNIISDRRQTAKPINYSKKPYTLRNYPKSSTTTTGKPYKYLENRRNNYRNRLNTGNNNNELSSAVTTTESINLNRKTGSQQQELNDLTALANTYGLSNKLQNNTNNRYSLLLRRTKPTYSLRTATTTPKTIVISSTTTSTTKLPSPSLSSSINSNLNLTSISNFVPFGNNLINKDINDNSIQFNLQNSNSNNYNNNYNNNNNQQHQHQHLESKNQKTYYSIGTQQGIQKTESNLIKQSTGPYTEIPGTNIKISKSNEETSFILSSDPRHQTQLIKSPSIVNKQKNGYIPLNEYITNTLNGEIRNLATQTQNPQNYNLHLIPQLSTISPLPIQKQLQINFGVTGQAGAQNNYHTNFQTSPQISNINHHPTNYGYQITATPTVKPYGHELINNNDNNIRNSFTSIGGSLIQQHQQLLQNENQINNNYPITSLTQSYYNSFGNNNNYDSTTQKSSTNVNIYNNLSETPVLLPDININGHDNNFNPNNLQSNYQNYIFNPLPIAQRRLDVVKDDEKETDIYNKGVTSYNVPIGSIGRLARRLALNKKQLQHTRRN